ncbi:MAG: pseudouridine synthase [Anaerolineaceae bacterium]|nr:pseudouridine synthase [Anaerolineaceae bacterium]
MEERLQKILARAGYGSRRRCEELIQYGQVKVNGIVAHLGAKADAGQDAIMVDGKKIKLDEFRLRYVALNKPKNVLSDCDSFGERKTVHDLIETDEHMFAVGRLDFDSEGLILMTNDGDLANKLTHPRYGHEKEYHVKVNKRPDEKQLSVWRRGVVMEDGYRTMPAIVQVTKSDKNSAWLKVILREGRKRQIREIGQLIGLPVARIIRVRIGTLQLGLLKPGTWRNLSDKEIHNLKSTAGSLRSDKKQNETPRGKRTRGSWSKDTKKTSASRREKYSAMRAVDVPETVDGIETTEKKTSRRTTSRTGNKPRTSQGRGSGNRSGNSSNRQGPSRSSGSKPGRGSSQGKPSSARGTSKSSSSQRRER